MTNVLHLSKLSRGHVELSRNGTHLEVFPDQSVCSSSFFLSSLINHFILGKTTHT